MAVDIGRMYITKDEAKGYAHSVAIYATQQLDRVGGHERCPLAASEKQVLSRIQDGW